MRFGRFTSTEQKHINKESKHRRNTLCYFNRRQVKVGLHKQEGRNAEKSLLVVPQTGGDEPQAKRVVGTSPFGVAHGLRASGRPHHAPLLVVGVFAFSRRVSGES